MVVVLVEVVMVVVVVVKMGVVVVVVCDMAKRDLNWTQKKSRSWGSRGQVTFNVYLYL